MARPEPWKTPEAAVQRGTVHRLPLVGPAHCQIHPFSLYIYLCLREMPVGICPPVPYLLFECLSGLPDLCEDRNQGCRCLHGVRQKEGTTDAEKWENRRDVDRCQRRKRKKKKKRASYMCPIHNRRDPDSVIPYQPSNKCHNKKRLSKEAHTSKESVDKVEKQW